MLDEITVARFWSKVDKRGPDECWPWLGSVVRQGRGTIWLNGKTTLASHLSLALVNRPRPFEMAMACHSCDQPNCVNPSHLWWGTNRQNILDASSKGRLSGQQLTHCKKGHSLEGDNVRITPTGQRSCKKCQAIHGKKHDLKRRAKAALAKGSSHGG